MPSVVHVYKSYPPVRGGIEGHIDLLTRLLVERGCEAEVLCARGAGEEARALRNGVRVRRCLAPITLASTPLPPLLPSALRNSAAELVHLHYPWPPNEIAYLLGGRGRPLVITVHCEVVRQARLAEFLAPLTRAVLSRAARILVTGPFMREKPFLAAHGERVAVVPLGVDTERLRPDASTVDPLPNVAHPRILFVGRLRHYKGLATIAAALARLDGAQLVVAGDGPERGQLEQALRSSGCRDRAHLLGEVDDERLLSLYRTADVAVLASTSNAEAFGLSVAEAQSCGVPAVTTEVGTGTAQTVADGVSGRVVLPNDADRLAEALRWCLDPERAPGLRRAARAHAESKLCARRMTDTIAGVYDEVLQAQRKPTG